MKKKNLKMFSRVAALPGRSFKMGSVNTSATSPIARQVFSFSPSLAVIPADSWPRCCSAWSPR